MEELTKTLKSELTKHKWLLTCWRKYGIRMSSPAEQSLESLIQMWKVSCCMAQRNTKLSNKKLQSFVNKYILPKHVRGWVAGLGLCYINWMVASNNTDLFSLKSFSLLLLLLFQWPPFCLWSLQTSGEPSVLLGSSGLMLISARNRMSASNFHDEW